MGRKNYLLDDMMGIEIYLYKSSMKGSNNKLDVNSEIESD